ncbi:hypothetical protein DH2020_015606 [Rehmannia glutinosa]|uniref:Uncharacterized protein n=1 Tax=Rehmannia glutinosa TaxID=99300 RepID=A0ABR0WWN2_REHGL
MVEEIGGVNFAAGQGALRSSLSQLCEAFTVLAVYLRCSQVMVPFQALLAYIGLSVNAVCPGKKAGEIFTAIHDSLGHQRDNHGSLVSRDSSSPDLVPLGSLDSTFSLCSTGPGVIPGRPSDTQVSTRSRSRGEQTTDSVQNQTELKKPKIELLPSHATHEKLPNFDLPIEEESKQRAVCPRRKYLDKLFVDPLERCLTQSLMQGMDYDFDDIDLLDYVFSLDATHVDTSKGLKESLGDTIIEELPKVTLELKELPAHLRYVFLGENDTHPIIASL